MANKSKLGAEGGSRVVSFRLAEADRAAYLAKVKESGLSQSEFFRTCVLQNRTQVVARPKATVETKQVLYIVNKAGNNLNQLAHRTNLDHLVGKVDHHTYADILYQLDRIARYLKFTLAHVD